MKRVLRFTASWCNPCQSLAATLEGLKNDYPMMPPVEKIDIDENPEVAQEYGVRGVPTLVMMDSNIEVKRMVGTISRNKLIDWISKDV